MVLEKLMSIIFGSWIIKNFMYLQKTNNNIIDTRHNIKYRYIDDERIKNEF